MPHGLYYYRVMSFRLKNVSVTYQMLMTKIFKPLIGRIVEVYINDIVVKRKTRGEHVKHLEETFRLIMVYNMKLNPTKYAFGVNTSKFLGLMVTQRGIEVNLDQIRVVIETLALSNKKELQCLIGCLAELGRFISRFTDKLRSFYLTLNGASVIGWTDKNVSKFVWKNIICQFRIPQAIVANNGPQFDSIAFRTFYSELKIKNLYSMPRYPQSNGQAEATNKILFIALKKNARKGQMKVGKRVTKGLMGILDNPRTTYMDHSFRLCPWDESHHSN